MHLLERVACFVSLVAELRRHDLRAARTWVATMHPTASWPSRLLLFLRWVLPVMWRSIPDAGKWASFSEPVSRTPVWLADGNPFENHPFSDDPDAELPAEAEVVVIGAGFAGSSVAYHWSRNGRGPLVILDRNAPASGSAGRNEGLVVMGRYYAMVYGTVREYLDRERPDLDEAERTRRSHGAAAAYAQAAYTNAEMIERTVREEGIECDYQRRGWVQASDPAQQEALAASTRMAEERGFRDWMRISPAEVAARSGMRVSCDAGFSIGAATWHPARWVWGLLARALEGGTVRLFTNTRVLAVRDLGDSYVVETERGIIHARFVVNAVESHTPQLFGDFHNVVLPTQTQAAYGPSDGGTMTGGIGISEREGFYGRHAEGVLFGSDATRVPDADAGSNRPSRFITRYVLTRLRTYFGVQRLRVTNEWSGTVSYTPDGMPLVGRMDGKRLYMIGGMAGSGSGVAFNAALHVVSRILELERPDDYPEEYFSPTRFFPAQRR